MSYLSLIVLVSIALSHGQCAWKLGEKHAQGLWGKTIRIPAIVHLCLHYIVGKGKVFLLDLTFILALWDKKPE